MSATLAWSQLQPGLAYAVVVDGIPWPSIAADTGGWALVGVFVLLVFTGRLVPRRTVNDIIADRDDWRDASRAKDAEKAEQTKQVAELREVGETMKAVLLGLQNAAGINRDREQQP